MSEVYDRQITLFGEDKQKELQDSLVLVLGCGALGNLVANNLARAGVNLRLVDRDVVEESNLHRTLFRKADVGRPKAEALKEIIEEGSEVRIEALVKDFNRFTWKEMMKDVDIVADCLDSMLPRYLLNEVSVKKGVPFVHGSAIRAEGRVKFFDSENECFRCLYPRTPEPGKLETCSQSGVLNSATSLVSSVQSNMVIKHLTGFGNVNKDLLVFDMKKGEFRTVEVDKNEDCEVCSHNSFDIMEEGGDIIVEETCEGYNVVPKSADVDLERIAENYSGEYKGLFTTFTLSGKEIILFENGRMQVKAKDRKEARSIYSKVVGL